MTVQCNQGNNKQAGAGLLYFNCFIMLTNFSGFMCDPSFVRVPLGGVIGCV